MLKPIILIVAFSLFTILVLYLSKTIILKYFKIIENNEI